MSFTTQHFQIFEGFGSEGRDKRMCQLLINVYVFVALQLSWYYSLRVHQNMLKLLSLDNFSFIPICISWHLFSSLTWVGKEHNHHREPHKSHYMCILLHVQTNGLMPNKLKINLQIEISYGKVNKPRNYIEQ